jgi:spermidine synthase
MASNDWPINNGLLPAVSHAAMKRTWPLYVVFFVAGVPALVYQVVWQRALSMHFGIDIYSTSITVATFMFGLGIGSLLGGHLADRLARPGVAYAVCEALLGAFGAASLASFRLVGESLAGADLGWVAVANFALLLAPTTLMGMTLPLMCQSLRMRNAVVGEQFATLYAVNTLGAAVGALLAAYLLVGILGLGGATLLAAAMNVTLGVAAFLLVRSAGGAETVTDTRSAVRAEASSMPSQKLVAICAFLSGFVALGYQLVWYRLLTLLLHGTVYVFGTILFVFLTGIALGSWYARRATDVGSPLRRFAGSQIGIAVYVLAFSMLLGYGSSLPGLRHLIGATTLTTFHPAPELFAGTLSLRSLYSLLDIGFWTAAFVGLPTFLMGFGFPQLVRAATDHVSRLGRSVGYVYFANIVGSTLGTLVVGFGLLHFLGSEWTLRLLISAGALTGLLASYRATPTAARRWSPRLPLVGAATVAIAVVAFPARHDLIRAALYSDFDQVDFNAAEDRSGIVALRTQRDVISFSEEQQILGTQRLLIDGSTHGGFQSSSEDLVFDSAVKLALAAHPSPQRVLSIGLGDGRMCAAAAAHPSVEKLVVVELNGALANVLEQTPQGQSLFRSPKLDLLTDDGRRWLLANRDEKFDVVLMWPLHAAHAYSGNLYSAEFFELVRAHLAPGGVLFARSVDTYSTAKTIASGFEHVVRIDDSSYVASNSSLRFSASRAELPPSEIAARLEADRESILRETAAAPLNHDLRPNTEYYLTYPYVAVLQTWGQKAAAYRAINPQWPEALIVP